MKRLILLSIIILLTGCAGWIEMGETGEMPVTTQNRAKAMLGAYCDFPVLRNFEGFLVSVLQVVIPTWDPSCKQHDIDKAAGSDG